MAYAGPAVIVSLLTMTLIVYVPPFYATEVGLGLSEIGFLFLLARAWDALIDPAIGQLSDMTRSPWGSRKPWMLAGMPLLMLSTWYLLVPPESVSVTYMLLMVFLYYLSWTLVQIPFLSWGAELSEDYHERATIVGAREGAMFIGVLLATGLPMLIFYEGDPTIGEILRIFAWITVVFLPLAILIALTMVPAGTAVELHKRPIREMLMSVFDNKPFRLLLLATFLGWCGVHIYNATVLMIIEYALALPTSGFLKLVFVQFLVGTLLAPLITRAASRWGKHRVLAFGVFGTALALPLLMLVTPGNFMHVLCVFAVLGVVISPIWILPTALVADVVDVGRLAGGGNQAGLYMSIYNLSTKLALALSVGLALPLLDLLGFDPLSANPTLQADVLMQVGLLLPAVLFLPAGLILWKYPIDAKAHANVLASLRQRQAASS